MMSPAPGLRLALALIVAAGACSGPETTTRADAPGDAPLAGDADEPVAAHVVLQTSDSPPPLTAPAPDAHATARDEQGLDRITLLALIERLAVDREPRHVAALDGSALQPMPATPEQVEARARDRQRAALDWAGHLDDEQAASWFGRRLAYEGRYHDAVLAYTTALQRFPESESLLRHRGHRFITLRRFARAETDLRRAAAVMRGVPDELEPDGQPNAQNVPRSTRHGNVLYHLGLALYLQGEFREASARWIAGLENAQNDDSVVSMAWWAWLSSRRAGMTEAQCAPILARIHEDMDLLENHDYHALLMLAKGERTIDELLPPRDDASISNSTRAYGVSAVLLLRGEEQRARELWQEIVGGPYWAAFGHIAAEAELARA